jgi:hypothetical protein
MLTSASKLVGLTTLLTSLLAVPLLANADSPYEPGYCAFDFLITGSKESIRDFRAQYEKTQIFHIYGGRCTEISHKDSEFYGATTIKAEDFFLFRCSRPNDVLVSKTTDIYLEAQAQTMTLAAMTCGTDCKPCRGRDGSYNCVSDYPTCRTLCK